MKNTRVTYGIALCSLTLLAGFGVSSCHDAKAEKDTHRYSQERPDEKLKSLAKHISDGDAQGFAGMCVYPIQRPYPLRDISDSAAMVDYFPVMIDDSLRMQFKNVRLKDWEDFGWRGWSLTDRQPIWYDEGVQFVDYVSLAERGLQTLLARAEIESLAPGLRPGWTPVMTLVDSEGGWIFRIDRKGEVYRLAGYAPSSSLREMPTVVLDGSLTEEGSAMSRNYVFSGEGGRKAEYSPDSDSEDCLSVTIPPKPQVIYHVYPAYWRDLLK